MSNRLKKRRRRRKRKNRIILPADQTPKQASAAVKQHELPKCVGNPKQPCRTGPTDFMIKGYDDKFRCRVCNDIHGALVFKEAGESPPNVMPLFVSPRLDAAARKRRAQSLQNMADILESRGHGKIDIEGPSVTEREREYSPMLPRGQVEQMTNEERRAYILNKYKSHARR